MIRTEPPATAHLIATEAPAYITAAEAADAFSERPWAVVELIESGDLRAVRQGSTLLVSADDVKQLGGVL